MRRSNRNSLTRLRAGGRMLLVGGLAVLVAGALAPSGCLFSTREPDTPSELNVVFHAPVAPDSVILNIVETFKAKQTGNYDLSLADEAGSAFTFVPDPGDEALAGAFFSNWTKAREIAAFNAVFANRGTVVFAWPPPVPAWGPDPDNPSDPNSAYYENIAYKMDFRDPSVVPAADTTFSGRANLLLKSFGGTWRLVRWVDQRDGTGNATLGLLRWRTTIWS